ncbi:MAG: hypothetical protein AABW46_04010 [Nanoarchaeota archaeon]
MLTNKMKTLTLIIFFAILLISLVTAGEITIERVESADVEPGQVSNIRIILENQGSNDIEDVLVSLDLSSNELPFAPIGSAAERSIDEIKEDDSESVSFQIITSPDAKPQIYKIPLTIKYNEIEESTVISIKVTSEPILNVAIEESDIVKVSDTGQVTIRFVNRGLSDIKFLTASLIPSPEINILSASSFYVGNIEPDDFETITFDLKLNKKISFIPVKVEYRDSENKLYSKTEFLDINIYSEEEAKQLGLINANYTPYIITTIILIIILFIIIRTYRKRTRARKLKL